MTQEHDLADAYFRDVSRELQVTGIAAMVGALIRACRDLIKVREEYATYKRSVISERQQLLADGIGLSPGQTREVHLRAVEGSGDTDVPWHPSSERAPMVSPADPASEGVPGPYFLPESWENLKCPNCGNIMAVVPKGPEEFETAHLHCPVCNYEEVR